MSARWTSNMPYHPNQQASNQSSPPYPQDNYYANYNAGQNLGSVGAPATQWTGAKSATAGAPNDQAYGTNGDRAIDTSRPGPTSWASDSQAQYQTPRRTLTIGRAEHELHIPHTGSAMSDVHHYGAPPAYGGDQFSVNVQQATPTHGQHSSNPLPSTLQPGMSNRPGALQANSSPSAIPTLPQISTQMQHTPGVSRSMTQSHSHSYSRSSPGNMDQPRYKPFSNTPETTRYPTSNSNAPQTPSAASPYSPLNLASIRTQAEGGFNTEQALSPLPSDSQNPYYQMSSSYVAPWPIYAVDWCKWPPRANDNGAGKVAIGSYLEDNHNYVGWLSSCVTKTLILLPDPNTRRPNNN
jgi:DDB1- and CUL4-associated factor 7